MQYSFTSIQNNDLNNLVSAIKNDALMDGLGSPILVNWAQEKTCPKTGRIVELLIEIA